MKLIDMHCDTIWKLMDLDKEGDMVENQCSISIPGMKKQEHWHNFSPVFFMWKIWQADTRKDIAMPMR